MSKGKSTANSPPRLLTKTQVAAYCGTTIPAFGNWVTNGWMPEALPMGRWDRKAIDAAIDKMSGISSATVVETESALDKWRREHDAREARLAAVIPGAPLIWRERNALRQLRTFGKRWADHYRIKECGADTVARLTARGFIETKSHGTDQKSITAYRLTEAGLSAIEVMPDD